MKILLALVEFVTVLWLGMHFHKKQLFFCQYWGSYDDLKYTQSQYKLNVISFRVFLD
jgi:hypothetical protein